MPRAAMSVATRMRALPLRKSSERAHPRVLRLVPVQRLRRQPILPQEFADFIGAALSAGEDEHAVHVRVTRAARSATRAWPAPATK